MTTSKSFGKVVAIGKALGDTAWAVTRPLSQLVFDFQWRKCDNAYCKFMNHNKMSLELCECVSDTGGIPIFTYDSQTYHLEDFAIPAGYVLLKITNCFRETTYAFAKVSCKRQLFPRHTVLCYFVDEEEWADECGE